MAGPGDLGEAGSRGPALDAHLHTELSPDSGVPIELYAADAARRGIAEIAITDHLDFQPGAPAAAYADYETRERMVRAAAERWAGRVSLRLGVELTYERRHEDEIRSYLAAHRYDYVIGSVHSGADSPYTPDRVRSFAANRSLREVVAPYFEEVTGAIQSGLFDTIGHLDYVKKYVVDWFPPAAFAAAPELYEPILRLLAESGSALEVNSSGLRQRPRETYPAGWVVERFHELGGERITMGSDAHAAAHFAFGLEEASDIVARAGFTSLAFRPAQGGTVALVHTGTGAGDGQPDEGEDAPRGVGGTSRGAAESRCAPGAGVPVERGQHRVSDGRTERARSSRPNGEAPSSL